MWSQRCLRLINTRTIIVIKSFVIDSQLLMNVTVHSQCVYSIWMPACVRFWKWPACLFRLFALLHAVFSNFFFFFFFCSRIRKSGTSSASCRGQSDRTGWKILNQPSAVSAETKGNRRASECLPKGGKGLTRWAKSTENWWEAAGLNWPELVEQNQMLC